MKISLWLPAFVLVFLAVVAIPKGGAGLVSQVAEKGDLVVPAVQPLSVTARKQNRS